MADQVPDFIAHVRTIDADVDQKVKYLREVSLRLREHSGVLKQQSDEIIERLQSCLNLKRAA